jgi:polyhydroxyalkanoate synthesis regulator phasin
MLEEVRKGLMASLGTLFLTRDKIEEVIRTLVEEAKLSREDAQRLTNELAEVGQHRWQHFEKTVTETVRKGLVSLDVSKQSDLRALQARVDQLETRLSALEAAQPEKTE